ncbi:MAG: PAS domain S-box protein [Anaerolineae bacterium]
MDEVETSVSGNYTNKADSVPSEWNLSSAQMFAMLESISEAFYALDTDWRFIYLNHRAEEMLNKPRAELIGKNIWNEFPSGKDTQGYVEMHRAAEKHQSIHFETFSAFLNRWLEVRVSPMAFGLSVYFSDINQRKEAENQLRFNEARLALLLDALPFLVSYFDTDMRYQFANKRYEDLFNLTRDQIIGKTIVEVIGAPAFEQNRPYIEAALGGQQAGWEHETSIAGKTRFTRAQLLPIRHENGAVAGVVIIFEDISERKLAELEMERLATIVRDSNDAIISNMLDGTITSWNAGAERMFGYSADEMIGKPITVLYPSDRMNEEEYLFGSVREGKTVQNYDTVRLRKDGSSANISVTISPLKDTQGNIIGASKISHDISERKQAEQSLQRYAKRLEIQHMIESGIIQSQSTQQVIETVLKELRTLIPCQRVSVVLIDEQLQEIVRFAVDNAGETSIGQGTRAPLHPNLFEGFDSRNMRVADDVRNSVAFIPLAAPLVEEGILSAVRVLLMEEGRPIGALGLFASSLGFFNEQYQEIAYEVGNLLSVAIRQMHLTQAMEAHNLLLEQRVAERTQQLEAVNKELDSFAYVVSHDLKAPLRGISQLSSWLVADHADQLDEEARKMLTLLEGRSQRMHDMIESILQYSRVGRVKGNQRKVNLSSLMDEVLDLLTPPDSIEITIAPDLPIVFVDDMRIRQMFQNLIGNAIKYMDKPAGKINISYTDAGEYWQFSIADNGPGIAPEYHEKVFQLFQTLAPRDKVEGTGIGLALVKKIVELHKGKVWLESQPGEGTIFLLTLPKILEVSQNEKLKADTSG